MNGLHFPAAGIDGERQILIGHLRREVMIITLLHFRKIIFKLTEKGINIKIEALLYGLSMEIRRSRHIVFDIAAFDYISVNLSVVGMKLPHIFRDTGIPLGQGVHKASVHHVLNKVKIVAQIEAVRVYFLTILLSESIKVIGEKPAGQHYLVMGRGTK